VEIKHPIPPFNQDTARQKIQAAEDAWNSKDPSRIAQAYSKDSQWRNRDTFITGREQIICFLADKWNNELAYKLKKELWCFDDNRIAVRFKYEWHNSLGQWFRSYGNELWQFDEHGLMVRREASINDLAIDESERTL